MSQNFQSGGSSLDYDQEQSDPSEGYRSDHFHSDYQEPTLVLTPLESRSGGEGGFHDESYEPFRLEMTPPESLKKSNRFHETTTTPRVKRLSLSLCLDPLTMRW
jgi:hypothetical protein